MKPHPVDLPIIWRGSDYLPVIFNWKDQNGNPFNLNGWHFFAQTRNFDLRGTITNHLQGTTTVSLPNSVTATLKLGTEQWNCWFEGPIKTPPLLAGKVEIKEKQTIL